MVSEGVELYIGNAKDGNLDDAILLAISIFFLPLLSPFWVFLISLSL